MAVDWVKKARGKYQRKQQGKIFKLSEGDNSIRILPGRDEDGNEAQPFQDYYTHFAVGPNKRSVTCGKDDEGDGDCWLCDKQIPKMLKSKSAKVRSKANRIAPKAQLALQVAFLDDEDNFSGPLLMTPPFGGGRSLGVQFLGVLSRMGRRVVDLDKGLNLNISRTGTALQTRYGAIFADSDPSSVPAKIRRGIVPFSDLIQPYDEDAMRNAYFGREDEDEPDDEPDEDEFDDELDDESEDGDEYDEDEEFDDLPDDEDEDEPDDEDDDFDDLLDEDDEFDEEPEPKPKPKRRKKVAVKAAAKRKAASRTKPKAKARTRPKARRRVRRRR